MNKRNRGRKFSRKTDQRKAFIKGLLRALFLKEKIRTTEARAKEIRPLIEKYITKARTNNLATRRYLAKQFTNNQTKKILEEIAPRYKDRKGGYARIIKLGLRKSDGARMALIELIKD